MSRPPGPWRRFRRLATYLLVRLALVLLRIPPVAVARGAGALMGALAYAMASRERRRALDHLSRALPDVQARSRRRIARAAFANLGRSAAEIAQVDRLRRRFDEVVELPDADRRVLEEALRRGRGVLVVAGHIGNWELMGFYLAWRGYPVRTLARGLADRRLSSFVRRYRESRGVHTILRGEEGASRAMLQTFREGAILGFFLDQDTDVPGTFVPFFGRPAWTPIGAGVLAVRTGAAVVVASMVRMRDGRHRLSIEPFAFESSGDRDADAARITADLTALLERAIRRNPAQWVWMHQRWKRQPMLQ